MNPLKKLSNPLLPKNLNSEISQFIAINQQVFAELITFIDFVDKFRGYL